MHQRDKKNLLSFIFLFDKIFARTGFMHQLISELFFPKGSLFAKKQKRKYFYNFRENLVNTENSLYCTVDRFVIPSIFLFCK